MEPPVVIDCLGLAWCYGCTMKTHFRLTIHTTKGRGLLAVQRQTTHTGGEVLVRVDLVRFPPGTTLRDCLHERLQALGETPCEGLTQ